MALIGFWSYVHADDDTDMGRITALARDITSNYEALSGEQIELFLDSAEIHWGDKWRSEVDQALSNVAFFIAVLTPRYFLSVECRRELQFFLERARSLGIPELVMPLRYIDSPRLHAPSEDDPLVLAVREFQWADWVAYRMEDRASKEYRTAVDGLAQELMRRVAAVETVDVAGNAAAAATGPSDEQDEPGVLDRLADMETALPELTDILTSMTAAVQSIGDLMDTGTEDIHRAERHGKGFAGRLTVARRLSSQLADPVDKVESLSQEFLTRVVQIDSGLQIMVPQLATEVEDGDTEPTDVCDFFDKVRVFADAAIGGLNSGLRMAESTRELERMSKDLRPPLRRLGVAVTSMGEARSVFEAWLELIDSSPVKCTDA